MDNKEDNLDLGELSNLEIAMIKKFRSISEDDKERIMKDLENNTLNKEDSLNLNEFTFENFVVGPSNRFAYRASIEVVNNLLGSVNTENTFSNYNPLLIYGEKGVGKTHLLNAIRNAIKTNKPNLQIAFVDENNPISEVSTDADVLLGDDVQLYMNDEFFNIYNSFIENNKQVVLTADKTYSQFVDGLMVDIKPLTIAEKIANEIEKCEGISSYDLFRKTKKANIVHAKRIAIYMMREITNSTYEVVGDTFGLNYSTVIFLYNELVKEMESDSELKKRIENMIDNIKSKENKQL
ncbi:MAG: hypothetical protein HDT34_03660 [Clostridiales bacterium]|nr:hypothetical protein [Clostridiales bacterium]